MLLMRSICVKDPTSGQVLSWILGIRKFQYICTFQTTFQDIHVLRDHAVQIGKTGTSEYLWTIMGIALAMFCVRLVQALIGTVRQWEHQQYSNYIVFQCSTTIGSNAFRYNAVRPVQHTEPKISDMIISGDNQLVIKQRTVMQQCPAPPALLHAGTQTAWPSPCADHINMRCGNIWGQ